MNKSKLKFDEDRLRIERRLVEQDVYINNRAYMLQLERFKIETRGFEFYIERFKAKNEKRPAKVEQSKQMATVL